MAEPALGIFGSDGIEGRSDLLFDGRNRARLSGAQGRLELGPAGFDRRQVGGVARQGQQRETGTPEPVEGPTARAPGAGDGRRGGP